ncbi:MAG: hypothetical protein N4A41_08825 [Crocinitomicaceae bacterium]|jgi:hypothetical protein|nr:hypothetical protein [Crocinitomicaceae bacterium]
MKLFIYIFTTAVLLTHLSSCRDEINATGSYQHVPVIYGLLDQADTLHYMKINRGFVGPGNALEFSAIMDSNYFENMNAKVEELIGGNVIRSWDLRDTLLNNKDTNGVFYGPTHRLFYFSTANMDPLKEDATYRLTVNVDEGDLIVTGETRLVANFATSTNVSSPTAQMRFAKKPEEYQAQSLTFSKGTSVFANCRMNIKVTEYRGTIADTLFIPWNIFEGEAAGNTYSSAAQGQSFYQTIRNNLTNDNTITKRNLEGIEIIYTGGAIDFYNYLTVAKPSSSLSQNKPTYTNLTVTDGYQVIGLFSSRHEVRDYKPFVSSLSQSVRCIDANSTRELCQGTILGDYLFCSQHPQDVASGPSNKDYACQ